MRFVYGILDHERIHGAQNEYTALQEGPALAVTVTLTSPAVVNTN